MPEPFHGLVHCYWHMNERHQVTQSTTLHLYIGATMQYGSRHYNFFAGIAWTLCNLISEGIALIKVCLVDFPTPRH